MVLDLHRKGTTGTFNIASRQNMSWYEFGIHIAKCFELDSKLLRAVPPEEYRSGLKYPKKSHLSTRKVEKVLGKHARSIDEGLRSVRDQLIHL